MVREFNDSTEETFVEEYTSGLIRAAKILSDSDYKPFFFEFSLVPTKCSLNRMNCALSIFILYSKRGTDLHLYRSQVLYTGNYWWAAKYLLWWLYGKSFQLLQSFHQFGIFLFPPLLFTSFNFDGCYSQFFSLPFFFS